MNTQLDRIRILMRTAIEQYNMPNNPGYTPLFMSTKAYHYLCSAFITVDTKQLKKILIETGGEFTMIVAGKVRNCFICKKALGVGVYNVWAKTADYRN